MVYTAATRSLALLEMLTQDAPLRANYVFLQAEIRPEIRVEEIDPRIVVVWPETIEGDPRLK